MNIDLSNLSPGVWTLLCVIAGSQVIPIIFTHFMNKKKGKVEIESIIVNNATKLLKAYEETHENDREDKKQMAAQLNQMHTTQNEYLKNSNAIMVQNNQLRKELEDIKKEHTACMFEHNKTIHKLNDTTYKLGEAIRRISEIEMKTQKAAK